MAKKSEDEVLDEAYRIGTEVLASMKKRTTEKMVKDLLEDYEQPIRSIIEETVLMTIKSFNLRRAIDIYDEIERKADEITNKEMKQIYRAGRPVDTIGLERFRAEQSGRKNSHMQRLLELHEKLSEKN